MKWIQLPLLVCPGCDEKHDLFHVFFRKDGLLGLAVRCKCGLDVEHSVSWSDALEYALSKDKPTTRELREEKKNKKKGRGEN